MKKPTNTQLDWILYALLVGVTVAAFAFAGTLIVYLMATFTTP